MISVLRTPGYAIGACQLARTAASSEALTTGTVSSVSDPSIIDWCFIRYGTTKVRGLRKYSYYAEKNFYVGYLQAPGHGEYLTIIAPKESGSVVFSYAFTGEISSEKELMFEKLNFMSLIIRQFNDIKTA